MDDTKLTILFIGSDPYQKASVKFLAQQQNIQVITMDLLSDRFCALHQIDCDIVIVDYGDLHKQRTYLTHSLPNKPTIFTGHLLPASSDAFDWPLNVRRFVNKQLGVDALIQAAQEVVDTWAA